MVERARDRDPLLLPAGEPEARLADPRVVAEREPLDELVGVRGARRPRPRCVRCRALVAEGDVLGDRLVEEVVLLEHERRLPAQRPVVERAQIDAVVEDRALGRLQQPGEQLDQRRLARAAAADDRDVSPGSTVKVMPSRIGGASGPAVAEADVAELDRARRASSTGRSAERSAPCSGSWSRRRRAGRAGPARTGAGPRARAASRTGPFASATSALNATNSPERERPVDHLRRADDQEQPRARRSSTQLHAALVGEDEELRAEDAIGERLELPQHRARGAARSAASALTVSMPRIASIWSDGVLPVRLLEVVVDRPEPRRREAHQPHVERHGREEDERERPAVDEHQDERRDELRDRGQRLDAALDQELAHLPHAREPALDVARPPRREVASSGARAASR